MGKDEIAFLLEKVGYVNIFDDLFISCDMDASKAKRDLFDIVVKKLNTTFDSCLMVGDNYRIDYIKPREKGIKSFFYKYDNYPIYINLKNQLYRIYKNKVRSFYDGYGFNLYFFTDKLYRCLKQEQVKDVFFLSREGFFLKELFDCYMGTDDSIKTHYLLVSRRSTYLPSLKELNDETFGALFERKQYSYQGLLSVLNFTEDNIKTIQNSLGISDEEFVREHKDFKNSDAYRKLRNDCKFKSLYEHRRLETKSYLLSYMQKYPDCIRNGFHIVDVGWKGTMQDNLYNLYDGEVSFTGYYLGLCELSMVKNNNKKKGILFETVPVKSKYYHQYSMNRLIYEDILNAPHASIKDYMAQGGEIIPIFDEKEGEQLFKYAELIQCRIMDIFNQLMDLYNEYLFESPQKVEKTFAELTVESLKKLSKQDLKIFHSMNNMHYNNFLSLKTVRETRKEYSLRTKMIKIIAYLKQLEMVCSGELYVKFSDVLISNNLFFLEPVYKWIVYRHEKRRLKREADM
ncbi:MAG: hypothetical protein LUE98_19840 [Tannerellaceae bacterium]|nr:hypothetical protein [Tannerellaceae bacterium]